MSTLPREIYIKQRKRRRDDEGEDTEAPAFLQIDDDDPISKRRMSANFVYQRRSIKAPRTQSPAPEPTVPVIHTEPERKKLPPQQPTLNNVPTPSAAKRPGFQPRHFHMSRASMVAKGTQSPGPGPRGVSKRSRYGPAVFVERGVRKLPSVANIAAAAASPRPESPASGLKRPGTRRVKTPAPAATPSKADTDAAAAEIAAQRKPLPQMSHDADVARLASDMDSWVLHEIGLNLKEMAQPAPSSPRAPAPAPGVTSPSKFRPKAPAQRFAERNPALAAKLDRQNRGEDSTMRDGDSEDASDDDYEIVVYELAPSDGPDPAVALASIPPEQIGVLRFDSREDMELFYGNDEDDSDWVPEDDEDENAENHYTAEYPEELDSDDSEFDGRGRGGIHDPSDDEEERVAAYYRAGNEFAGDYNSEDEEDRYIVEGDDESRDPDEIHQERIRRYIRQHGGN
ncbi:hypothetical protein F5X68DRAFT_152669 [Plectosphaerella plurivora]|uniref:Transcription factor Iwr1 domain-containing protein n=1 Tax=Plectosphaerella plurivora TaxID=936078 RepID=A0A9P8VDD9_9PEZI|nr:hypothetical protein F5X68DRAFT_152669 [Plectosphaerella plurivora]